MAGNARSNGARNQMVLGGYDAPWFRANVKRWRRRNRIARLSRRMNRHR
jgi:hypothetical protein